MSMHSKWISERIAVKLKKAIEKLFGVKVVRVNTMINRREARKFGARAGTTQTLEESHCETEGGRQI